MKIQQVAIKDFLSLGEARFSLAEKGLVLLQGCNEDNPSANSNGAGKSSLVDAVCWALFGETARGIKAAEVVRCGAKAADVRLLLEDQDGTLYRVERTRQKTSGKLTVEHQVGGSWIPLTLGTEALTQAALNKILGCGPEVFRAAVYLGQDAMPDLPSLTDKKLKELIEEAAGVGILETAYAKARERSLLAERTAERSDMAAQMLAQRVDTLKTERANLGIAEAAWQSERGSRVKEHQARLDAALVEALRFGNEPIHKLDIGKVNAALDKVEGKLASFKVVQDEERRLVVEQGAADRKASTCEAQFRDRMATLARANAELARLEGRIGELCDACGHPLDADALAHALSVARDAIATHKRDAGAAAGAMTGARQTAADAGAALTAHRGTMGDPTTLQGQAKGLRERLDAHRAAVREVDRLVEAAEAARVAVKAAEVEGSPYATMLRDKAARLMDSETALVDALLALAADASQRERLKTVVGIFGPAGVRAHILDQVTPYLNERTSVYLDALADGTLKALWATLVRDAKGNLKEKFCIEVTHPAGEGFAALSGGEKRKVRIACALALQDLVASRATKPMSLFVADEVDDGIDEAGLERLMGVFQEKAKERGTVLLISHNDLKAWIPNCWVLTKRAGVSELEMA